ncbi:MAG: non-hydrolyzing UDP-N-acetylglucosamine 2-epimerase [Candidatus Binatia bacterium]
MNVGTISSGATFGRSAVTINKKKILTLFGTRPEVIKLAPVIQQLERCRRFCTVNVTSAQHTDLLYPFARLFNIRIDHDLGIMQKGQTPNQICARVLATLDPLLTHERPDLLLVQGDTSTALAGALAGFHHGITIGHVEAGLRSGDTQNPYPEEMNRRLISRLATYHFAATAHNRLTLLAEGIPADHIFVTGNPVVDALKVVLAQNGKPSSLAVLFDATATSKRVVLTTHRRESFGMVLGQNLRILREFVERHEDVALFFPVHPNPEVQKQATAVLSEHRRIHLLPPLEYPEFLTLLSHAWLVVSDSGGVQEEAPTLGRPVLILRENTERPEAIAAGVARLVGGCPQRLSTMLEEVYHDPAWVTSLQIKDNPFGQGDSGKRIVEAIRHIFAISANTHIVSGVEVG